MPTYVVTAPLGRLAPGQKEALAPRTVDLYEIRPEWRDKSSHRQRAFVRVRYVRPH